MDRDAEEAAATEVRRDSTLADLEIRREGCFEPDLAPFREPFEAAAFADLALKRAGLVAAGTRPAAFFVGFALDFAFVAIDPANLYGE